MNRVCATMDEANHEFFCFKCLCRQIQADFSDKLVFSHAVSDDCAFPIASTAVVQMSSASLQFTLAYLPRTGECLKTYIDDCCGEDDYTHKNINTIGSALTPYTCSKSLVCCCSGRFSCTRTITALAPIACVRLSSYSAFEEIASNYVSEPIEDHILSSLSCSIEGKTSGLHSRNLLTLIGIPPFDDEDTLPGCLRHPNIAPILGMLKTPTYINIVIPKTPFTLENVLHFSPDAFKSDWHKSFLIYQILSALAYMHGLGIAHGNICPSNVMLSASCWSWLPVLDNPQLHKQLSPSSPLRTVCCINDCPSRALYADLKLSDSIDWGSAFTGWWSGELSNFEYLLILNRLAGRRWGDHTFHMVMPWVIDFSVNPDETNNTTGWRDLKKSKWRLAKGDEQLDFTYSTSEIPHHISDECLSELAVCSYKARRLPLSVLRTAVRSVYEPNEYPSSMQRLYQWTPDECIPEFYCDPEVFYSIHTGMADLAVPSWAGTPEEFIKLHRRALESSRVSCEIHHWIDITFGYKMAGLDAVAAKNVMLSASTSTTLRSSGRRQLFAHPHPARRTQTIRELTFQELQVNPIEDVKSLLSGTSHLQELEKAAEFREHARHLSPVYSYHLKTSREDCYAERPFGQSSDRNISRESNFSVQSNMTLPCLLENIELGNDTCVGYQELLLWMEESSCSANVSQKITKDMFSVGCIIAELYLGRPLFDPISLDLYLERGVLPGLVRQIPPHTKILVEACLLRDWKRRPSAKRLLECPYFPPTVRSSYLFLAPLQLLVKDSSRLRYIANFAKEGAFKAMGPLASEMCALYCLPLLMTPMSDIEAEWAYMLLYEFLKCLKTEAVTKLILPAIQKILQTTNYSRLKVSLLQDSFVREIWKRVGKQAYLESIHPVVLSNLHVAPHESSAAASVLLIGSSEELGVPVTVYQTILPLIHCFGKGLCADGIDVLVRIGCLLGENFAVRQILPLLRNVVSLCTDASCMNKPEPQQNWSSLAIADCLMTLDGVAAALPREVVVKELIEDGSFLHVMILTQTHLELAVLQVAATSLLRVCELIGPDLTALHILPKLRELFEELAFSQEATMSPGHLVLSKPLESEEGQTASRMDLVLFLYPPLAALLGIEKLRQCCATWLLLEQFLLQCHKWKWEYAGESFRSNPDNTDAKRPICRRSSTSDCTPAKLLLNGVGWSMPQSQGCKGASHLMQYRRANETQQNLVETQENTSTFVKPEPWHWFPSAAGSYDGPDYLGRAGSLKDERPWKIRASVINSTRAHHGAIRCLAVCHDECTVFTAGVSPGFKGAVQKWDLSRIDCSPGYWGHDEVVNDISVLSSSDRVASCDGTVHVWNSQTGKLMSIFSESSNSAHVVGSASKANSDQSSMLNCSPLSSAFDGSLYTCMHHLEFVDKLVVGTGNGSLRFIDVLQAQKLHLWRSESAESSFQSLVSCICSCGSDKMQTASPSWIAAGLSSGFCRLLDIRSGNIISSWRAHDGYVTKLAAPEEHLLITGSLDRTLRVWDLRRNLPPAPTIFRGHSDSISDFAVWGLDVISIAKNKIGISSLLSRAAGYEEKDIVTPQHLYSAAGVRNMSALSSLTILPFSRLFLVGTEDGHLKICC